MAGLKRISSDEADQYAGHFANRINDNEGSEFSMRDFAWGVNNEHRLSGFRIGLEDYLRLVNTVGATSFYVRFGLKQLDPQPTDSPNFTLLLQAMSKPQTIELENGQTGRDWIEGPHYMLDSPISVTETAGMAQYGLSELQSKLEMSVKSLLYLLWKRPSHESLHNLLWIGMLTGFKRASNLTVPGVLSYRLMQSWKGMVAPETNQIPKSMFRIGVTEERAENGSQKPTVSPSDKVLNGYTMTLDNLINVMNPFLGDIQKSSGDEYSVSFDSYEVDIFFANHVSDGSLSKTLGSSTKNTIGLIAAGVHNVGPGENDKIVISNMQDFSAPCPPTCGHIGGNT